MAFYLNSVHSAKSLSLFKYECFFFLFCDNAHVITDN